MRPFLLHGTADLFALHQYQNIQSQKTGRQPNVVYTDHLSNGTIPAELTMYMSVLLLPCEKMQRRSSVLAPLGHAIVDVENK